MGLPYRTDEEVRQWMSRDPIPRYKKWLLAKGLATEAELADIEKKNQAAVEASIEFARKSADPAPEAGVLNTYAKRRRRGDAVLQPQRARVATATDVARGRTDMAKKSYNYAQLEARRSGNARQRRHGVLLRIPDADRHPADRRGARPREGVRRRPNVGPGLADRRAVDRRRGDRRGDRRLESDRPHPDDGRDLRDRIRAESGGQDPIDDRRAGEHAVRALGRRRRDAHAAAPASTPTSAWRRSTRSCRAPRSSRRATPTTRRG